MHFGRTFLDDASRKSPVTDRGHLKRRDHFPRPGLGAGRCPTGESKGRAQLKAVKALIVNIPKVSLLSPLRFLNPFDFIPSVIFIIPCDEANLSADSMPCPQDNRPLRRLGKM